MKISKIWGAFVAAVILAGTHLGVTSANAADIAQKPFDKVRAQDPVVLYNGSNNTVLTVGQTADNALQPADHYSHSSHQSHWSHQSHYSSRY